MKVLYYDCFCGISGDMHIAAMLDLGVPQEYLLKEISKLKINSEYEIKIQKTIKTMKLLKLILKKVDKLGQKI